MKELERRGKWLLRGAFRLLPSGPGVPAASVDARTIGRILVIRLDNRLGNLLLITPFLARLRACFPGASIDVLVSRAFASILRGNPDADGWIVADKAGFIHRPWRFIRFVRDVRRARYDLAVDLSSSHTFSVSSGVAVRLTGAPLRLGYRRGESDRFLNVLVEPPAEALHEAEIHRRLLADFGGPEAGPPRPRCVLDEADEKAGGAVLRGLVPGAGPVVGIFLGARGEKAWGDENFLGVARALSEWVAVLVMGGPAEARRLEAIRERLAGSVGGTGAATAQPGAGVVAAGGCDTGAGDAPGIADGARRPRVAPVLPLRTFAGVAARCALFITGDCGPMHLVAALGVPVLAVFTGSDPVRYGPLGEGHRVLHAPGERTPGRVIAAAREMLRARGIGTDADVGGGAPEPAHGAPTPVARPRAETKRGRARDAGP